MTVYLFLPNLIGYARIVLALVGYAVALKDHQTMLLCYMGSQFLDAIDGLAARMLGQSSQFGAPGPLTHAGDTRLRCVAHLCAGAVLDMVTDRASTACLCIVLGALYPQYVAGFCSLIMLDLSSHWCGGPRAVPPSACGHLERSGPRQVPHLCSARSRQGDAQGLKQLAGERILQPGAAPRCPTRPCDPHWHWRATGAVPCGSLQSQSRTTAARSPAHRSSQPTLAQKVLFTVCAGTELWYVSLHARLS